MDVFLLISKNFRLFRIFEHKKICRNSLETALIYKRKHKLFKNHVFFKFRKIFEYKKFTLKYIQIC